MKPTLLLLLGLLGIAAAVFVTATLLEAHGMGARARGKLFDELEVLPHRRVGLVLGCVPLLPGGRKNLYFEARMKAAAELYHARKVDYLLVSGDNHRHGYDEPTAMRDALVNRRVPQARIVLDYAGLRTLDSIVRAKEIFGQSEVIIVSQQFHNERALYLAQAFGLDGVAYNAPAIVGADATWYREPLARVRAVLDVRLFNTRPKFDGPRVVIGESDR